jgi:iron complex transport system ATP-binding protein
MIKINNLTFGYFDSEIFRNLNFEVNEGEIFTILGPNGSGKTTLLKCVERLLNPKGGNIIVSGKDLRNYSLRELGRTISSVPQIHKISFPYTVLDMVLMGRNPHLEFYSLPSEKDVEIAMNALKEVGILHLKDMPYTDISGGELRLTLIARVLTQNTSVVILDEPTAFLDFKNEFLILNKIRDLRDKKNLTVLMTMHDPNQALRFSDRVLLMKKLEVVALGKPAEVLTSGNLKKLYDIEAELLHIEGSTFIYPKEN